MRGMVLTTDGFEDSELSYPYYRLREAGYDVDVVTPDGEAVEGEHGYEFDADYALDAKRPSEWGDEYDLLVVPGGNAPESLRTEAPEAADVVRAFDEKSKPIAAICHAAQLLVSADVVEGRDVTAYWTLEVDVENAGATFHDRETVVDDNLVTARHPADLPAFMADVLDLAGTPEAGEPTAATA